MSILQGTVYSVVASGITFDGIVCGTVGNFVVVSEYNIPGAVRWCAIGDPTDWPTPNTDDARAKQAGREHLNPKLGVVTGIVGNDFFGYVFQEWGITKMSYVGGDAVFNFDTFSEGIGCFRYNRIVQVQDLVFFESQFGYHMLQGGQVTNIGAGVVDSTYPPLVQAAQVNVAVNPAISTVFFEGRNIAYNYHTQQWSRQPALIARKYYSLDGEDDVIGQLVFSGTSIDDQTSLNGASAEASLETAERDLNQGGRALVDAVRPLVNGGTVAVYVGVRNDLDDTVTYSTGTSINSRTGMSNFRSASVKPEGRYQRLRLLVTDDMETALGADVEFTESGRV